MKTIKLKSMAIKHFKGIKNFSIDFRGDSTDIFGDNDAGKTSLYDAFLWVLFHKDSHERAQFDWKPLDANNKRIEGLQTSVQVVLTVDGTDITFEKQKISKQVLKRKLERKVYEDTTKYLIDGLETTTRTMYDTKVAEILDQERFKNLTSITYFSEQLSPKERREALFQYFGTKTDEEIINDHEELKPLFEIMENLSIDDARKKVQQEAKRINETLKDIPVKIEGIQAAMPELKDLNRDSLNSDRLALSKVKNDLEDTLLRIKSGGAAGEYRAQLRLKEAELQEAKIKHENQQNSKFSGIEQGKAKLFGELNELKRQLSDKEFERENLQKSLERAEAYRNRLNQEDVLLRQKFDEIYGSRFDPATFTAIEFDETKLACAYCGTEYTLDRQSELREHHEAEEKRRYDAFVSENEQAKQAFEVDKQTKIEAVRAEGKANNAEAESNDEKINELNLQLADQTNFNLDELKKQIEKTEVELTTVSEQINKLESAKVPFEQTPKYSEIKQEIEFLTKVLADNESSMQEQINAQQSKIDAADEEIRKIDNKLAMFNEYDRQQQVIETFNEQEREFSERKGVILEQLALFEEFYITKRDLLQEHINSHFSLVEWKLFDFYEEGGLDESVCEPMIGGVSFRSLNTGSRMQAGLDVANTLMKQEGYLVPIFIDNAEAMTDHKRDEVRVDTQVIALYVKEADKNLRVINH